MEGEQYQNWIWHTLYFLECRNAPKGKITGMVTREKLIQFIQELEKESWEKATTLEKQDGDIDPPLTRVQIANHIRGLKGRKLIKEYKNSKDEPCLRTI